MHFLPEGSALSTRTPCWAEIYPEISVEISGKFQSRRGNQEKCGAPIGIQKFFHSHKRFLSLQRFYSGNRIFRLTAFLREMG
jgi:hypothetical protein